MSDILSPPFIFSILLALTVHEWAHAFAADRLGDRTARMEGRLTLNPVAHLDLLGTILFLAVGFGWGKPVPIDPRNFRHPKRDTAIVALAGPFSNLVIAIIVVVIMNFLPMSIDSTEQTLVGLHRFLREFLLISLQLNLVLMAFNLLPIAPLDGSKILAPFIPLRFEDRYENFLRMGSMILLFLIVIERIFHTQILSAWIDLITSPILQILSKILS